MRRALVAPVIVTAALVLVSGACSSSTKTSAKNTVKNATNDAKQVVVHTTADGLSAAIKHQADVQHRPARSIEVVKAAVGDLHLGDAVTGVTDANHDGLVDSGAVQVEVSRKFACLKLPSSGKDVVVDNGRC
jgi:uncharacterized protein with FMN-binding domain